MKKTVNALALASFLALNFASFTAKADPMSGAFLAIAGGMMTTFVSTLGVPLKEQAMPSAIDVVATQDMSLASPAVFSLLDEARKTDERLEQVEDLELLELIVEAHLKSSK